MFIKLYLFLLLLLFPIIIQGQGLQIKGGHSHNDYLRTVPLFDAIKNNLISVEADIYPVANELLVGHDSVDLKKDHTLETMYFVPLQRMVTDHKIDHIILLIDIKQEAEESYRLLKLLFSKYSSMLTLFTPDSMMLNSVTVILSGERPWSLVSEHTRFAGLDGRFDDISFKLGFTYFPLISDDWVNHFKWNGAGDISIEEKAMLDEMIKLCHQQHKIVRFWGYPSEKNKPEQFWTLFQNAGVDLLGVDAPVNFHNFVHSNK